MYDPTFTATNAHLDDLGRAASGARRQQAPRPRRPGPAGGRLGTIAAISFVGVATTGLIALTSALV